MILKYFDTPRLVAEAIIRDLIVPGTKAEAFHLAVSGGSTPRLLFELMAEEPFRSQIGWASLHLYWVDERCVAPTDPDSNYGMTKRALLDQIPLTEVQIHRIRGEEEPEREASRYTDLVRTALPLGKDKLPVFDLILLGMGDDGHTSSIFPHQMRLLETPTPYVVATHPSGQKRIALTGPTILAAKQLAFHAVGASKGRILSKICTNAPESKAYPSAYLLEHREDIAFYTDQVLQLIYLSPKADLGI